MGLESVGAGERVAPVASAASAELIGPPFDDMAQGARADANDLLRREIEIRVAPGPVEAALDEGAEVAPKRDGVPPDRKTRLLVCDERIRDRPGRGQALRQGERVL